MLACVCGCVWMCVLLSNKNLRNPSDNLAMYLCWDWWPHCAQLVATRMYSH
jgi:hypothetical protein